MAVNFPGSSSGGGGGAPASPFETDWLVGWTEWTHNEVYANGLQIFELTPFVPDYVAIGTAASNYHQNTTTDTSAFGVHQWVMSSSNTGYGSMTTDVESINTGVGTWRVGCRIKIPTLPVSGGEDFYLLTGFNSLASYRAAASYALIGIDLVHNATNFIVQTHGGSGETVTDTGVAFAINTWYNLEIEITATTVSAWIDGVLVLDASTSNVPVAATVLGASVFLYRRIGTSSAMRSFLTDLSYIAFKPGVARGSIGTGGPWG